MSRPFVRISASYPYSIVQIMARDEKSRGLELLRAGAALEIGGLWKSASVVVSGQCVVDVVFDVASDHAFEELPGERYSTLDMKIAVIVPASDIETRSSERGAAAVIGPFEAFYPARESRRCLADCRLESGPRDLGCLTMFDGDFQMCHRPPLVEISRAVAGLAR